MNLQQRARELTQGTNNSKPAQVNVADGRTPMANEQQQEVMQKITVEHVTTLNEAIKEIYRVICNFSAVTDRVEHEKREIIKLTQEVNHQKVEVSKVLYDLEKQINAFPKLATASIESAVGETSQNLREATNGIALDIQQKIVEIFEQQADILNQSATRATKSANELIVAKKFVSWQALCINVCVVLLASCLLITFITPKNYVYKANAEEQKYIEIGKNFEKLWPKLSEKVKNEINAAHAKR